MPGAGFRFRTSSLTVAVAVAALGVAATRTRGDPGAGLTIVGACVIALAHRGYSEAVARRRARGVTPRPSQKAAPGLAYAALASITIGLSDLAFLAGYHGFMGLAFATAMRTHRTPGLDPGYMLAGGAIGLTLALGVASLIRRTAWGP